jgi:hypothetical protein
MDQRPYGKFETLKLPRKTIQETGIGKDFPNWNPAAQEVRTRIDKEDCIKLKSFCTVKETITRIKS